MSIFSEQFQRILRMFVEEIHVSIKLLEWDNLFELDNRITRKSHEICLKLTIKTPEQRQ